LKTRISEDAQERKETPIYSGFIKYFPHATAAVAAHSFVSNEQHNPGEPLHWAREKSGDETDAIARHLTDLALAESAGDLDQQIEDARALAWRSMANLEKLLEKRHNAEYVDSLQSPVTDEQRVAWNDIYIRNAMPVPLGLDENYLDRKD
jgi:hypothetical protein